MNAQTTVERFLAAFSRLDLDGMMALCADDAIAFFPAEHGAERLEGCGAIRSGFERVISRARSRGLAQITLSTADVRALEIGDAALVSAHLRDDPFGRRTFVLRREASSWRIVHLHASNVSR